MSETYSAFISYRHHPLDSAVAADVQRRLERFHIPAAIRRQTGKKRIDRLFRDKSELAITSDINDDILQALEHSGHLIVICSTHTAESIWVQREIEHFLRTHDHSRVLTVLVDGEPQDVIPEILRWQQQTVTDENGDQTVVRVPVEPLSCDYRHFATNARARRTALREELPRLAAALLGCPYDALRQRQRQYRMRRLAIGFTAALLAMTGLAGYFLWSSLRIQQNYEQSLRSQSLYLAEESLRLVEDGDRLTALHLALEALPSPESPRPLLARAEYALGVATAAYTVPGTGGVAAVCSFDHSAPAREFFLSKDSTRLFVLDSSNTVTIWDTQSYQKLQSKTFETRPSRMALAVDDTVLLVMQEQWISAYDCSTGDNLWMQVPQDGSWFGDTPICVDPDTDTLYLAHYYYNDEYITQCEFIRLDAATGQQLQTLPLPSTEEKKDSWLLHDMVVSADEKYIAAYVLETDEDYNYIYHAFVYDIAAGALQWIPVNYAYIGRLGFTDDDGLVILGSKDVVDGSVYLMGFSYIEESICNVLCWDLADRALRWENQFSYSHVNYDKNIFIAEYPDENGGVIPAVACTIANRWLVYAADDGRQLRSWTLPAAAVNTRMYSDGMRGILSDGQLAYCALDAKGVGSRRYFADDLIDGCAGKYFVAQQSNSSRLLLYRANVADDSWQPIPDGITPGYIRSYLPAQDALLLTDSEYGLYCIDDKTCTLRWQLVLGRSDRQLGLAADGGSVLYLRTRDDGTQTLLQIGLADGDIAEQPLPISGIYEIISHGDFLVGYSRDNGAPALHVLATDGSEKAVIPLPQDAQYPEKMVSLTQDLIVFIDEEMTALVDVAQGAAVSLANTPAGSFVCIARHSESGRFALVTTQGVGVYTAAGQELMHLDLPTLTPAAALFADGETLLLPCTDNMLYRYAVADGALLGQTSIAQAASYDRAAHWLPTDDGYLIFISGSLANVISTTDWMTAAYVPNCVGFLPGSQSFITSTTGENGSYELGYFPRHTVPQLMEMAAAQLGENVLDEPTRRVYGLTE